MTIGRDRNDKYVAPSSGTLFSQCMLCTRLDQPGAVCEAFPNGIPNAILENRLDHRKRIAGDQGVTFQLDPEVAETDELNDDLIARFFTAL